MHNATLKHPDLLSSVKVMTSNKYALALSTTLLDILCKYACILVVNDAPVDPGFMSATLSQVCPLNETTSFYGTNHIKKGTGKDLVGSLDSHYP
ncbi:hypothetical protein C0995_015957 [Termitomyces sp. Mi166|nr:hypothetical protein C0995_015957 [Termitomyces sp. Mi166\